MAQDPIDEFIALPKDQQLSTLQKLSPEKQNKLLGEIKTRKSKAMPDFTANPKGEGLYQMTGKSGKAVGIPYSRVQEATKSGYKMDQPAMRQYTKDTAADPRWRGSLREQVDVALAPGEERTWGQKGIAALKGTAAGFVQPVLHPIQSAVAQGMPFLASQSTPSGFPISQVGLSDEARKSNREVQEYARQQMAEQGAEIKRHPVYAVSGVVGPALVTHGVSRVLPRVPGVRALGEVPGKVKEGFRGGVRETMGVPESTEKVVAGYGKEAESARGKNAVQLRNEAKERQNVTKRNLKAKQEHQAAVEKSQEHNKAALRDEAKRVNTEQKLNVTTQKLEDKIGKAQVKAKAADDAAWDTWRKKTAGKKTQSEPIVNTINAQRAVMDPEDVAEFRRVLKESKPGSGEKSETAATRDQIAQTNLGEKDYDSASPANKEAVNTIIQRLGLDADEPVTLKEIDGQRLHVWKTQLEYAVRSATRGNVRYAIGQVLDKVRAAENKLSEEAGAKKELDTARSLHGPYVDTFRNPPTAPRTVAGKVLTETSPERMQQKLQAKRLAMLGKYDKSIPATAKNIADLRKGLKALPKEAPMREKIEVPPAASGLERYAKPGEPTEMPKAPNLQEANARYINNALRKYGRLGSWVLRLVAGGIATNLAHGNISLLSGDLLIGQTAVTLLTKALRSESVLKWLSAPSAEDIREINSLPPADAARMRQALGALAQEERRTNPAKASVPIAPAMAAFLGGRTTQAQAKSLQQLRQEAEQRRTAGLAGAESAAPATPGETMQEVPPEVSGLVPAEPTTPAPAVPGASSPTELPVTTDESDLGY
jgi:hypothetical protein